jgi:Flp pilus assembly protein TadD
VTGSPHCSRRRFLRLALCAAVGLAFGALGVVPSQPGRAVVAVARIGHTVRLLPSRLTLSFLPLARRVALGRRAGEAVIPVRADAALPAGVTAPLSLTLHLSGAGRLPLDAAEVRALGWEGAWTKWFAGRLALDRGEAQAIVTASRTWRSIFPSAPPVTLPDLAPRLARSFAPLRLDRVDLGNDVDPAFVRASARAEVATQSRRRGRLVVLGLDACDWDLVDELVARGLMPNVGRLIRRGASAVDTIPAPLISPVVWTTIATGVPPEVHGVLDFLEPDPAGGVRPVTSASRQAPALWEMLAAAGRSTATIGWWATFPAHAPPGGSVYSDRLTEQLLGLSARVPSLADPPAADAAAQALALHARDVTPAMLAPFLAVSAHELAAALAKQNAWDDPIGGLAKLAAATLTVERLTRRELDSGTQVVLAYLEGTDTVGHLYGAYRAPALPIVDPRLAPRFGPIVDRYYHQVDGWIGEVAAALGPADTLVLVSDHGFRWGADRPRVASGAHTATAVMWHRPEGFFLAAGPRVRVTSTRERMGVLDVAPSLLALAGAPPAAEMPGHVPDWLLAVAVRPEPAVNYAELLPRPTVATVELPPAARAEELAKLRALGYLAGGEGTTPQPPAAQQPGAEGEPPIVAPGPKTDRAEARRLNNLAISQASSGEKAAAEETFKKAIAADPTYASAYYSLSVLLRKQDRLDEADTMFWQAVRFGVRERELAVVRLALDYNQRGMPDKAAEVLAKGREMFPDSGTIWQNSGVFLGERGDLAGARDCLDRAVSLEPSNASAHRNLAVALLGLGDRDGARRELARAVAIDPNDAAARKQLAALRGRP